MADAESEYQKLKGLLELLERYSGGKDQLKLHEAEQSLTANAGNLDAMSNLERNLRGVRLRILAELSGIIKDFER